MSDEQPQIYLLTPPSFEPEEFGDKLARVLDDHEIVCLRMPLVGQDEYHLGRAADACREIAHARDVAIVIDHHIGLVERHGLDGVHLEGSQKVRKVRETLGADAIIGAYCAQSRHDGMGAGEAGADYVSFGPAGPTGLGDGAQADPELFTWWSQMIELPVVAEGALNDDVIKTLAPVTDFFAIGDEIWREDDPSAALARMKALFS